jgi:deoxyribodipyrimidine photo-lyase
MKVALHWFRCDLRLCDNSALSAAVSESDAVISIFIFDPVILSATHTGAPQVAYMIATLQSLQKDIALAGGRLIFRHGAVEEEMRAALRETGAHALYFNRDYEPYARQRDAAVEKLARSLNVEVHPYKDGVLHEAGEILKADGTPYGMFTPYSHAWKSRVKPTVHPAVKFHLPRGLKEPAGIPLPTAKQLGFSTDIALPAAGERAAQHQLEQFVASEVLHYKSRRDFPALDATSRLSPHLRMGTISPRTVLAAVERADRKHPASRAQTQVFVNELIWRDFFRQILWHFPHVADSCFKPQYNELKWENNERLFTAWCEGRTGFPMVDAGMRQLNRTGWMHNRVRMITAMFLTKDLLVSWQWGERYFMQRLFDADLASNNGGWQWSASTGTDSQPYFRIFNPTTQAQNFDPEGHYIRRYVPEADTLDYPAPIVDHAQQRVKALTLFKKSQASRAS